MLCKRQILQTTICNTELMTLVWADINGQNFNEFWFCHEFCVTTKSQHSWKMAWPPGFCHIFKPRRGTGEEHPFWYFSIQNVNKAHATCGYPGVKWFGELGQGIHSMADTWHFTELCKKQHFSGCRDFTLCAKQATILPLKKPSSGKTFLNT